MLHHHDVLRGIVLDHFPHPCLSLGKVLVAAHILVVEHDEQRRAVLEIVAHPFLARITVERIVVHMTEVLVAQVF